MGYSHSIQTVRNRSELLAPLLKGGPLIIWHATPTEEASQIAYKLRECRAIAERRKNQLPELDAIFNQYEIRVDIKGHRVLAIRKKEPENLLVLKVAVYDPEQAEQPISSNQKYAISSEQVIQAWIDKPEGCTLLNFEEAPLDEEDLEELQRFAANIEPPWKVIHDGKRLALELKGVS